MLAKNEMQRLLHAFFLFYYNILKIDPFKNIFNLNFFTTFKEQLPMSTVMPVTLAVGDLLLSNFSKIAI
jgi:hypothetical protein